MGGNFLSPSGGALARELDEPAASPPGNPCCAQRIEGGAWFVNLEEVKSTLKQWPTEMILSLLFTNPSGCVCSVTSVDSLTASGALALQGMREYLMIFITSIIIIRFSQDAPAPRENTKLRSMLS